MRGLVLWPLPLPLSHSVVLGWLLVAGPRVCWVATVHLSHCTPPSPNPPPCAVGSTPYTFENTEISCVEDPGVGLAAEIQAAQAGKSGSSGNIGGDSGPPTWLPIAVALPAALALTAAAAAAFVLLRRRQRAAARLAPAKGAAAPEEAAPLTPRSGKLERMESGDLKSKQLNFYEAAAADAVAAAAAGAAAAPFGQLSGGSRASPEALSDATVASGGSRQPRKAAASMLWRARHAESFCTAWCNACCAVLRHACQGPRQLRDVATAAASTPRLHAARLHFPGLLPPCLPAGLQE